MTTLVSLLSYNKKEIPLLCNSHPQVTQRVCKTLKSYCDVTSPAAFLPLAVPFDVWLFKYHFVYF